MRHSLLRAITTMLQPARISRVAAIVAASLLLAMNGCATLRRQSFQNPTVELKDVVVKGIGLNGGSLDVILDVYNPNDYRIDARRVTYTVFADSLQVATGEVTKLTTLDNRKMSTITLPVTFTMRELTKAAGVLLQTGSIEYTVQGDFTLATPFGSITRPYKGKGRYDSLGR
jgi:LEA14-like dessication related protein